MKLITSNGQMELPREFSFTIEQHSPVVAKEGTQSIPAILPSSSTNLAVLGQPTRLGNCTKVMRKIPATLQSGVYHKQGQLVVESSHKLEGITAAVMLNESDLYSRIKDVKLKEVFAKIVRDDFSGSANPVDSWYNHLFSCMTKEVSDDFTLFPVAVGNTPETGYQMLNAPDCRAVGEPWPLHYKARRITEGDETQNVPQGYGITPFIWMGRALQLLFAEWNYTVHQNPFITHSHFSKIVLINNVADTICTGKIRYSDLVPDCTVAEFLTFLENRFLMHAYIYPEGKRVDIVPLQEILTAPYDEDISSFIDGEIKHIFPQAQEVSVESDTTLQGAEPPMETIFEFNKKYKVLTELDEEGFRNRSWKYSLIKRKATGEYYEVLRKPGDSSVKINRLGSNYFKYYSSTLPAREYKAQDLIPPMVEIDLGLLGTQMAKVMCPYIGAKIHSNTVYKDETSSEQKIIIAMSGAEAQSDANIISKTYHGTTQKYNNLGVQWSQYDITPSDIYKLCFSEWNNVLMNSARELECKADYPTKLLLSFRMDKLKLLRGQRVLPASLSYTIGERITHNISKFISVKALSPMIEKRDILFHPQEYMWEYVNNAAEVFAEFDTQEWESYTWEYINQDGTSVNPNTFEFIPPPTEQEFLGGEEHYRQENDIRITAIRFNTYQTVITEKTLISYFIAVRIV